MEIYHSNDFQDITKLKIDNVDDNYCIIDYKAMIRK